MKQLLPLLLTGACSVVVCSDSLLPEDVPSAFRHLFAVQKGPVTVDLYGEELTVAGQSKFRTVVLDGAARGSLSRFLEEQGVLATARKEIIAQLLQGVESSSACQGLIAECALYPEQFDFAYDEKTRRLRVFINEKNMDFNHNKHFYAIGGDTISLVNRSSLYGQKSQASFTTDWQNNTFLSLPLGYLTADTTLTFSDNERRLDVYDANYVVDRNGYSLSSGFQTLPAVENSAYAVTRGQNASALHATLFSNQRLQERSSHRFGELPIFVPESTDIEILRDSEVLYRGVMPQGLNKISLATFPSGSYSVDVIFRVGGQVVKQELRYIYNIPAFTMATGEYDWLASAGQLRDNRFGNFYFLKGAANGRFFNTLLTGLGYTNVDGASVLSGYVAFVPGTHFRTSLSTSLGLDGSAFLAAEVNLFGLYGAAEWLHSNQDAFRSLFDAASFRLVSTGWSFNLLGSYFNLSYTEYISDGNSGETAIASRAVFLNGAKNFSWCQLSGTVQYDLKVPGGNNIDGNGNWFISLNLAIPLEHVVMTTNYAQSRAGQGIWRNSLRGLIWLGQQTAASAEMTVSISPDNNAVDQQPVTLSSFLTADHGNAYFTANGNLFLDGISGYNGNITLQSTQLVNRNTFRLTSGNGSGSYLLLNSVSATDDLPVAMEPGTSAGYLELRNKSMDDLTVTNLDRPSRVVPLNEYCQYQVKVNDKGTKFISTDTINRDYFAKPGTFLKVLNRVAEVNQYIVSFINDRGLVSDLRCHGPGCAGLSVVTHGVYRLSVLAGQNFQLYSGADICLLPEKATGKDEVVNLGRSICVSRETLTRLLAGVPNNYRLYYLGISRSVAGQLKPDTYYVRVGSVYGRFQFAKGIPSRQGDFLPRLVELSVRGRTNKSKTAK